MRLEQTMRKTRPLDNFCPVRGKERFRPGVTSPERCEYLFRVVSALTQCFRHYPEILQALFFLLERENEVRVVDNICAAVCRMICTNISKIPMEQA